MPDSVGEIIDDIGASGKSDADADSKSSSGNQGRDSKPEVLFGFDAEQPNTERFGGGGADGVRRTKSGKPDRRTRAGRTGTDGTSETPGSLDTSKISLEGLLYSLHLMGMEILKLPEMEIDRSESKKLADAIAEVNKFHHIAIDPKKLAYLNLGFVAITVYGPRFVAARNRMKIERESSKGAVPIDKTQPNRDRKQSPPATTLDPNGKMGNASPSMLANLFGAQDAAI